MPCVIDCALSRLAAIAEGCGRSKGEVFGFSEVAISRKVGTKDAFSAAVVEGSICEDELHGAAGCLVSSHLEGEVVGNDLSTRCLHVAHAQVIAENLVVERDAFGVGDGRGP